MARAIRERIEGEPTGRSAIMRRLQRAASIWCDHYKALLEVENEDIGPENTYFWDVKAE